jgi:hypothetical protein
MTLPQITNYEVALRLSRRFGHLRPNSECTLCGYRGIWALFEKSDGMICYECRCLKRGKTPVERHHIYGRENGPETIPLPGNFHRLLTDLQEWQCYEYLFTTAVGVFLLLFFIIYEYQMRKAMAERWKL